MYDIIMRNKNVCFIYDVNLKNLVLNDTVFKRNNQYLGLGTY